MQNKAKIVPTQKPPIVESVAPRAATINKIQSPIKVKVAMRIPLVDVNILTGRAPLV